VVNGLRMPVVAGVGGGVGTSTVAVALRGRDARRDARAGSRLPADILVCRGTLESLRRAAAVLDGAGPGPRPVLAVMLDGTRAPRRPLRARLDVLRPEVSAVVLLPAVRRWRDMADPFAEAAALLTQPVERLPRDLRAYARALRELATAVAASGRLQGPPAPHTPRAARQAATPGSRPATATTGHPPVTGTPGNAPAAAPAAAGRGPRVVAAFRPVVGPARGPGAVLVAEALTSTRPRALDRSAVPRGRRGVQIIGPPGTASAATEAERRPAPPVVDPATGDDRDPTAAEASREPRRPVVLPGLPVEQAG
jgi:hypothetical protein